MVVFTSQITLTHCGHYALTSRDAPRARAQERYHAVTAAAVAAPPPVTPRLTHNVTNAASALNVLRQTAARPGSARAVAASVERVASSPRRPNTARVSTGASAARRQRLATSTGAAAAAARFKGAYSSGGAAPAASRKSRSAAAEPDQTPTPPPKDGHDASRQVPPDAARESTAVATPFLMQTTYATTMGTAAAVPIHTDRLERDRQRRHELLLREFDSGFLETTRSANALVRNAEEAARRVPRPPAPPVNVAPFLHNADHNATEGDGTGVGGPHPPLLSPRPSPRAGPLERLLATSATDLQLLRRAREQQVVTPRGRH